jgi:hypothetical protein
MMADVRLGSFFDRDESSSRSRHVGYAPESGSGIAVMGLCGLMASPGASRGRHQSRDEVDDAFEVPLAFLGAGDRMTEEQWFVPAEVCAGALPGEL